MRRNNSIYIIAMVFLGGGAGGARAADWIVAPSYYSHDPATGQRVRQFAPIGPFHTYARGDFQRSVYRQTRSSIQAGGSADHMHIVEEWGKPVRPYGEWRFPYRPYSVPYDAWGPAYPSLQGHRDRGVVPLPFAAGQGSFGRRRGVGPGEPDPRRDDFRGGAAAPGFQPYPGYHPQPWDDGRYPPYDSDGPYAYPDLPRRPSPAPAAE